MNQPRNWNRKHIDKYIEIYIKSKIQNILLNNKKKIYKLKKNIVGINIKPQFPKKPDIIIENNFNKDLNKINLELKLKVKKILIKKKYVN